MSLEKSRPRARRAGIAQAEERAWIGFYRRVGSDPAIAAEVIAQLDADPELKRTHLALYLSSRESLRRHKARAARHQRVGQFVRGLADTLLVRPLRGIANLLGHGAALAVACLPETAKEPARAQARRLTRDPAFAAARADFECQSGEPAPVPEASAPAATRSAA